MKYCTVSGLWNATSAGCAASPDASQTYRLRHSLLRAEDPFKHGSVREDLIFDDFAVAVGERIGLECGFSAGAHLREDDHDIVVGEETVGRYLKVLLGHLREQFLDPVYAAIRSADCAVTGYDKLDVVVVVAQDRFDVALAIRAIPLLGFLDVLTCCHVHSLVSVYSGAGLPEGRSFRLRRTCGADCS